MSIASLLYMQSNELYEKNFVDAIRPQSLVSEYATGTMTHEHIRSLAEIVVTLSLPIQSGEIHKGGGLNSG